MDPELEMATKTVHAVQNELERLKDDYERAQTTLKQTQNDLVAAKDDVERFEEFARSIRGNVPSIGMSFAPDFRENLKVLRTVISDSERDLEDTNSAYNADQRHRNGLIAEIERARTEKNRLESELSSLVEVLAEQENELRAATARQRELALRTGVSDLSELNGQIQAQRDKMEGLVTEEAQIRQSLSSARKLLDNTEAELRLVQEKIRSFASKEKGNRIIAS